jgi:hypothetical protein
VEAFIRADLEGPGNYAEFEWAPNGEQLDLTIAGPEKEFAWSSGMESAVTIDEAARVWRVEVRIPLKAISSIPPGANTRWRINLYRHDKASGVGLALSPTLRGSFHTPARFGWLQFQR